MKIAVISFCTTGIMRNQFIDYCYRWKDDLDVVCITNDNVSKEELGCSKMLNLSFKRKKPWSYFSWIKHHKIKSFLKDEQPDIVLIFTPSPVNIFINRFIRKHFLYAAQIHDPEPHLGLGKLDRIIRLIQIKQHVKYADGIFVAAGNLKNQLLKQYDVNADIIYTVPLAITRNVMFNVPEKTFDDCDIDAVFFGRIEEYKGIDVLIEATNYLPHDFKIAILGNGKEYYDVHKARCKLIYEHRFVPDNEMIEIIARSKVVVLPYKEASGTMTVGTSFFYKKPVVATDTGCFREYVGDGGIIVKPNDPEGLANALVKACRDRKFYSTLKNNAIVRIPMFTLNNSCLSYESGLEKICNK